RTGAAFEIRHQLFERAGGGVTVASVALAWDQVVENTIQIFDVVIKITGGRIDRGGDRDGGGNVFRRRLAIAHVDRACVQVYFLFHLTPSFVSSRITP